MRQGVMRITTLMAVFGQGVLTTGALQAAETPLPAESAVPAKYAAQWNASVNREWKTRADVKVREDGILSFRGFRGRYRLSWTGEDGKTTSTFVTVE